MQSNSCITLHHGCFPVTLDSFQSKLNREQRTSNVAHTCQILPPIISNFSSSLTHLVIRIAGIWVAINKCQDVRVSRARGPVGLLQKINLWRNLAAFAFRFFCPSLSSVRLRSSRSYLRGHLLQGNFSPSPPPESGGNGNEGEREHT